MTASLTLARDDAHVVNPATGQVLALAEAPIAELAEARAALTALDHERKSALALLDAEIVARTDAAVRRGEVSAYTFTVEGYHLQVDTPAQLGRVDVKALRAELLADAEALELTLDGVEALFTPRTTYTLSLSRWNTMARQVPEIEAYRRRHAAPLRRSVSVTPPPRRPHIDSTSEDV